ncbi:MAG TPA: cellulase family glycosylhydrolase [Acidimicrobiales bacterium]|nr:cellulase family glycosylhydrolase [Acidimicrobiales bacterium]
MRKLAVTIVIGLVGTLGFMGQGTGSAGAETATVLPAFGVQFHATWGSYTDAQRIAVLDKLAAANVRWVRIDIGWAAWEEAGKGQISQWQADLLDRVVAAAEARNINVLGTLWRTPAWANGGKGVSTPPTDLNEYGRFATYIANRYKGRIAAWEVWNEPNLTDFWANADPVKYAALARVAYPAFKAGDPNTKVVIGSVSQNDTEWLTRMYDAGVKGAYDILSTHPYQGPSDAPPEVVDNGNFWIMDHIGAVRSLMVARGDSAKPIWATEFGWSSHANTGSEPSWNRGVSESAQADYLVRSLNWFATRHPYVTNMFWYNERNKATGNAHQDNFGILRNDLSEKPAYASVKKLLATVSAPTTTTTAPAPTTTSTTAPAPTTTTTAPALTTKTASPAPAPAPSVLSYRLVGRDGRTFAFGDTGSLGNTAPLPLQAGRSIVASVATPNGGAWASADDGAVYAIGNAPFFGSMGGTRLNKPIVGMDGTPSGNGYWLVASDGGIFSFGDARFFGSTGAIKLNKPIVGMAATPSGNGYWLVASDGGIFAFGDARFFGSTGGIRLNQPIVGMAPTASGNGYWLVASDGGIFTFGNAAFLGSTGSIKLNRPITGMVPTPSGLGYWFVASDGGVFSFGDARFLGSAANFGATISGMVAPAR